MTGDSRGAVVYAAHRAAYTAHRAAVHAAATALPKGASDLLSGTGDVVLDVAWANPTVAQVRAAGAVGVIGYFSHDPTKNLTPSQVSDYALGGIRVCPVWETTAGRALAGYAAGQADARDAEQQRRSCGLPDSQLLRWAVDTDTTWNAVAPYAEGWSSVLSKARNAVYGGYKIVQGAYGYGLRRNWQTVAWSHGQVADPGVISLYQNGHTALSGNADINIVQAPDWGQYPPLEAPMTPQEQATLDASTLLNTGLGASGTTTVGVALQRGDQNAQAAVSGIGSLAAQVTALDAKVTALQTTGITDAQLQQLAGMVADTLAARLAE